MNRYVRVTSGHSHLYPGLRLQPAPLKKGAISLPDRNTTYVSIEYSDDNTVVAELRMLDHQHGELLLPAYRTARGTAVAARTWPVTIETAGKATAWKLGKARLT